MKIEKHPQFKKSFEKRISHDKKLTQQFQKRMSLFAQDSSLLLLKDHKLIGKKRNLRSFSVTGDIRVVYQKINDNRVILLDIGTHNQVY